MLRFIVRGSQGDEYQILLEKSDTVLKFSCTCTAGLSGTCCKHRLALLAGDVSALLSDNTHDMVRFKDMISGSAIERRFANICALEKEKEALDTKLKAEKKAMSREISGSPTSR